MEGEDKEGPCPLGPQQRAWGRAETVILVGEAMALGCQVPSGIRGGVWLSCWALESS